MWPSLLTLLFAHDVSSPRVDDLLAYDGLDRSCRGAHESDDPEDGVAEHPKDDAESEFGPHEDPDDGPENADLHDDSSLFERADLQP